jgi:hypothetical protein
MPLSVPAVLTANVVAGWGPEGRRWLDALPEASVRCRNCAATLTDGD